MPQVAVIFLIEGSFVWMHDHRKKKKEKKIFFFLVLVTSR